MNGGVVLMYVLYPGFVVFHNFFDCCVVDNFVSRGIVIVDYLYQETYLRTSVCRSSLKRSNLGAFLKNQRRSMASS